MSHAPRYALLVLNWRTPALTVAAVRSAQRTAPDPSALRFIVIDNGSGDDSLAVFRRELPEVEVIALPENQGFARAITAGLARVREPYAFLLNSDIEFRNDAVTILAAALTADPLAVLACPKLLRPNGSLQSAAVPHPSLLAELTSRSLPGHLLRRRLRADQPTAVPGIVGPCMAVDVQRLAPVGFLDERFFFFFEETDWCRRIADAGLHVLYVPAAEVMHLQGESANRRPIRARVQFYQSRYKYFRKHGGAAAVALLFAGLWLRLTVSVVVHALLTVLTLGRQRHRDRLAVYATLWYWHLRGCRPKWGFEP